MNIAKGRDRMVIVAPKLGVVIKIAFIHCVIVVRQLFGFYRSDDREYIKILWKRTIEERGGITNSLFGGIYANWTEYRFYQRTHNHFVQPTYFSLFGIINIQKYGVMCTTEDSDELVAFWNEVRVLTQDEAYVEPHHFKDPLNFCMHGTHVRMVDYGNKKVQGVLEIYGDILAENLHYPTTEVSRTSVKTRPFSFYIKLQNTPYSPTIQETLFTQ